MERGLDGQPGPPMSQAGGGRHNFVVSIFLGLLLQTSSCAKMSLLLPHRYIVYTGIWQVSSRLKEDENGSQPRCQRVCRKINFIFNHSRSPASKLAIVPECRLCCDKGVCYINVCDKSH